MEFERKIPCRLVKAIAQEGEIDGTSYRWWEIDLLRDDEPGVIATTIGERSLNGEMLEPGRKYIATMVPKAMISKGRAFVSDRPKCVGMELLEK